MSLAYLRGQSSPTGQTHGLDKSPFFMGGAAVGMQLPWLWMARQLLQGVLERDELPQRRAVCGSSAKDFITAVWEYSGRWCWERRWAVLTESNAVFILTGTL